MCVCVWGSMRVCVVPQLLKNLVEFEEKCQIENFTTGHLLRSLHYDRFEYV